MYTSYERIYEGFLAKIQSYDIYKMTEDDVRDCLHDYLVSAIPKFHVCRKDLTDRDDLLQRFNQELSDTEIEIIVNYMVLEYVDATYIRVPTLLKVSLSSSDFNAFSNANLLSKLTEMQKRFLTENETLLSRYAWSGLSNKDSNGLKSYTKRKHEFDVGR